MVRVRSERAPTRGARLRILRSAFSLAFVSLLAASCLTPSFKLDDGNGQGVGGQAGGGNSPNHCRNDVTDAGETSKNCGGPDCDPCEIGLRCLEDRDCKNDSCVDNVCADPTCTDKDLNQDETDVDCGGTVCGATCDLGERCLLDTDCESGACKGKLCVESACNDNKQNSGETDVDCGGSVCGATCDTGQRCRANSDCRQPDDTTKGTARCIDALPDDGVDEKRCRLTCPVRTDDCDEIAQNGCETSTDTSLEHCGGCGRECDPAHTVKPICDAGSCKIDPDQGEDGCVTGYANCDGKTDNGCEINLKTDPKACGTCDTVCSDQNGTPGCMGGACTINCDSGFRDCDAAVNPGKNGCETNIRKDTRNCGGCVEESSSFACMGDPEAGIYPVCMEGECDTVDCSAYDGLADCDGDGACDESLTTAMDCGACGVSCIVQDGLGTCSVDPGTGTASCSIYQCSANHANCDSNGTDCEVDVRTNDEHCGGCAGSGGVSCLELETNTSLRVTDAHCEAKKCVILACDDGYADCDLNPTNGCETNTGSATTCGGCLPTSAAGGAGVNCQTTFPNANVACSGGNTCTQTSCMATFGDCSSGAGGNAGCETSVTTVDDCGSCDNVCGGDQNRVQSRSCTGTTSYSCNVTCQSGYCPNSTPQKSCTVQLGQSLTNCKVCGDTCTGTNPFCDPVSGCMQRIPVSMVQAVTSQATGNNPATVNFTVSAGSNRGVVVAVAAVNPPTIRYQGGSPLTPVISQTAPDTQGVSAIVFIPESALGGSGAKSVTVTSDWGGKVVTVYELKNVAQTAPVTAVSSTGTDCPLTLSHTVTVGAGGSFTAAVLIAPSPSLVQGTPVGLTESAEVYQTEQTTGLTGYSTAGSNFTAGWGLVGTCYSSALATATFAPLVTAGP